MSEWVLSRWKRYGHDRLYAETADGAPLGFLDLRTNELHPDAPADLPLLAAAVAGYLDEDDRSGRPSANGGGGRHAGNGTAAADTRPQEIYTPRHEVVDWEDLSARPPAAARQQAVIERPAVPLRVRFARLLRALRLVKGADDDPAWPLAAENDVPVAAQLARLAPAWRTVHGVPIGEDGADVDHLIVGPAGVFTVSTKYHSQANVWVGGDAFLVNGVRTSYVRSSRHEATCAERLLTARADYPISVAGIIAVVGAQRGFTVKEQPRDGKVAVVAGKDIGGYLASRPQVLGPAQVDAIFEFARRSTTWRPVSA